MITINIASYKRLYPLMKTMTSLIDQCDHMNIALNNTFDPRGAVKVLNRFFDKYADKMTVKHLDNEHGDGARYLFDKPDGWLLTVDDDITYPPGYVDYMIGKAKQYEWAIITAHGKNLKPGKRQSLLWPEDRLETYRCLGTVYHDVQVEIGGTGVMCFRTDLFYPDISRFERKNMADLWVSIQAKEQGIPIICVEHKEGWLKYHLPPTYPTIWNSSFWGDMENGKLNGGMADYHASIVNKYLR